jgi:hypothetical protein
MPRLVENYSDFVGAAIGRFKTLRKKIDEDPADNKRVSTSELLDWLQAYNYDLEHPDPQKPKPSLEVEALPMYHQALLKTLASVNREKPVVSEESSKA